MNQSSTEYICEKVEVGAVPHDDGGQFGRVARHVVLRPALHGGYRDVLLAVGLHVHRHPSGAKVEGLRVEKAVRVRRVRSPVVGGEELAVRHVHYPVGADAHPMGHSCGQRRRSRRGRAHVVVVVGVGRHVVLPHVAVRGVVPPRVEDVIRIGAYHAVNCQSSAWSSSPSATSAPPTATSASSPSNPAACPTMNSHPKKW